ncbi:MAG: tetraacyldisaccharide 4'-kinase [Bacteroidales bacterium]|nr:tetraacyldisaccharide 4'-kinase [Bacteroidales bacterium]
MIHLRFPDHHEFSPKDILDIITSFNNLKTSLKYIVTTEKDAVRLAELKGFPEEIMQSAFYVPVSIEFLYDGDKKFNKLIKDYVGKDK